MSKGWKCFNHAWVPENPYCDPDTTAIEKKDIWQSGVYLARWTTDFDCGYETQWWYAIKDAPFDISSLKSNRRYKITKGMRNFDVRVINPCDYKEELFDIQVAAFSAYPEKYRPTVNKDEFTSDIDNWDKFVVFGAFFRETGEMKGYTLMTPLDETHIELSVQKSVPQYERYGVNAALVEKVLAHYSECLQEGGIISDGARTINHETNFQDYLGRYFGFRKAYCKLHIKYNPKIKMVVKVLYCFRGILNKLDGIGIIHSINSILKMEEIMRKQRELENE